MSDRKLTLLLSVLAVFATLLGWHLLAGAPAFAADVDSRWFDRGQMRAHTGTTDVDIGAADYTSATVLLTIEPATGTALHDCKVTFDLDFVTAGFSDTHTTQTITFNVARKIDGTNYRIDQEEATTAITGTASNTASVTLDIGNVGPDEDVRVYVTLSAENAADFDLPYVFYYLSPRTATFTDVAN